MLELRPKRSFGAPANLITSMQGGCAAGLFEWSMRHQDGTHPSDPAAVRALSDEDRHFLEQAMQEYSQACPADERVSTALRASSSMTLSKQFYRWLHCQVWPMGRCR